MPENAPSTRWSMLIFLLVWLLSAVYLGANLNKGWVPHDEGTLGQSAERVLHGEIPHRDFEDPYTGGLAYIDAAIFKLFGINLLWLRLFLFACFLVWVPAVYALAREFLAPWPAAGVTLVAVAWSVPNYPAAMPSWFNLFFATFGTLALAKYIRRPCVHWLVVAGLCGGISFLIKSVALYYVAGALLFFVYREQLISRNRTTPPRKTLLYLAFLTLCLSIFVFTLIKLVFAYGHAAEYLHFVFPGLAVALLLAYGERTGPKASDLSRFSELFKMAAPFLVAAVIPVAFFCIFYWHHKAMDSLVDGLYVGPFRRLSAARREPSGLIHEYPAVIAALFLIEVAKLRGQPRRFLSIFLTAFAALVLLSSRHLGVALTVGLASALGVVPVLILAAVVVLFARTQFSEDCRSESNERLALFLTMTALLSLVQFPYSNVAYFCYFATLAALLAACLISRFVRPPRIILTAVVAFYVFYAAIITNAHFMGDPDSDYASTPINLLRAGAIRVSKDDAVQYEELVPFIKSVAGGKPILAGPDCPEVYFLSGLENPTPVFFDSISQPQEYNKLMQVLVDRSDFIKVAVINESPNFSYPQLKLLQELVYPRFPESRKIGRFTVYWRH